MKRNRISGVFSMYDHNRIKNHINGVESCSYELFGAHIENGGVYFSVYAPSAVNVKLIASHNDWQEIQMDRDMFGVWSVFIDGILINKSQVGYIKPDQAVCVLSAADQSDSKD